MKNIVIIHTGLMHIWVIPVSIIACNMCIYTFVFTDHIGP